LFNRTDILGALADYSAIESALQLEVAKQYPDIHLSPGYEFDQGDNKWGVGLSMELPILNHNRGPIAEAAARRAESAAKFNALQARVLGEIEIALAGSENARQKFAGAAGLVAQSQRQERVTMEMFQAGEISSQAVAAAKLESATAALAQLDARVKAQQAVTALEAALQSPLELPTSLLAPPANQTHRP
jgi:outer membrane protein TolC